VHDEIDASRNGRDDEPGADVLARQHPIGSVQVARPAQTSANLRSQRDVAHDTGRRGGDPTSTAPTRSEPYSP
jgi:hypothetical protein